MFSIKLFFIWAPQKCLACRFNFQWSKQKRFQMKLLIADRFYKTLNAADGNILINWSRDILKVVMGNFHIILLTNPADLCVCYTSF